MAKPDLFTELKKSTTPAADLKVAVMELFEKAMNDKGLALTDEQKGKLARLRAQIEIFLADF